MTPTFVDRLDGGTVDALFRWGRHREYPTGSIMFFEGDEAHEVLVVRRGEVKISVGVDGREVLLDVLGAGHVLGELSAIDGGPRSASATALTPVLVSVIAIPSFEAFLGGHPDAAVELLRTVAMRLRDASRRQAEFGAPDSLGRVCRRLSELIDRYGEPVPDGVRIDAPLTQQEIAGWAGLSREAVVKGLHTLRKLGWVTTSPRAMTVHDVEALRQRAALAPESP